jgi:3-oxoacyl-[acyl-carrier protein] reductase
VRLKDKVTIITGGANGIGRETAITFAREGAKLIIADFDTVSGEELVTQLKEQGVQAHFEQVDVSKQESVLQMVAGAINAFGKIDILINNAGITRDAMLKKLTAEQWQQVIDVNLSGVFYCTQAVLPHMLEQESGKIINTSSIVGLNGNLGQTNYAAAKAGLIGMTKTWAKELGRKGINVNAVAPGFIETSMVATVPEKVLNQLIERVPLQRLGKPSDIANAYLYLASAESDYVNGTVLQVDGGVVI